MKNNLIRGAFGHHKCGSMWIGGICEQACQELGIHFAAVYTPDMFNSDLPQFVSNKRVEFLSYGNADFSTVKPLIGSRLRAFHYVRDPRDIVVSAYFSHKSTHSTEQWPELVEYRERLRNCSKDEGLFLELEFRRAQFEEMRSWNTLSESDGIRQYRMEDLSKRPFESFLEMFEFLEFLDDERYTPSKRIRFLLGKAAARVEAALGSNIRVPRGLDKLPTERVLGIVSERNFQRLSGGRKQGQEHKGSHYRKGVHADWLNHFSPEHLQSFKENYGDLVLQYGYETDADWDLQYIPILQQRMKNESAS